MSEEGYSDKQIDEFSRNLVLDRGKDAMTPVKKLYACLGGDPTIYHTPDMEAAMDICRSIDLEPIPTKEEARKMHSRVMHYISNPQELEGKK